jgi:hypothetical protein
MPIGASKVGVLGAGLVPGGTETFNAPGTFSIPPGVKKVSITGRGGTGNPGNAGNQGNPGNPGSGGGGGASAVGSRSSNLFPCCIQSIPARSGGAALRAPLLNGLQYACPTFYCQAPNFSPSNNSTKYVMGGGLASSRCNPGAPGQQGFGGNDGTAGNCGNPGNPGNASNALGNTFPGGCGGNAGVGGAAGNAGTAGQGGTGGLSGNQGRAGGAGGNGGGQGGQGNSQPGSLGGVGGGGGAGAVNSGANGTQGQTFNSINQPQISGGFYFGVAGGTGNPQVSFLPVQSSVDKYPQIIQPSCLPNPVLSPTMQGGIGGGGAVGGSYQTNLGTQTGADGKFGGWVGYVTENLRGPCVNSLWGSNSSNGRHFAGNYNNPCLRPEIVRAGGGGGGSGTCSVSPSAVTSAGGGGGGGGRGNAGNASGPTPTPTGSAGAPQTFNCVPVTPGTPTPITVGGPTGGQIVISWNPQ